MRGGPAHDGLTDFIESVTNMSKKAKYALCKMHGGPADCPPVMLWKGETDEAIEKSVNLAFDIIGKGVLDNALDFGKFLFQQSRN